MMKGNYETTKYLELVLTDTTMQCSAKIYIDSMLFTFTILLHKYIYINTKLQLFQFTLNFGIVMLISETRELGPT